MRIRKVIITKNATIANRTILNRHPNVKKCWFLPQQYTLFEFYHPVFERIYDSDLTVANAARLDPAVRAETIAAVTEEQVLLAPLYQNVERPSDALTLLVPSQTVMYYFLGLGKGQIQWPRLERSVGWETAQSIRVEGRLSSVASNNIEELGVVLREWSESMTALGELSVLLPAEFSSNSFSAKCDFHSACGDASMALFMLLTESRYLTGLEAVGFFLPGDLSASFVEIGGCG